MIVILGAGISGLLLANRLKAARRKFVVLEKSGINSSGNDRGFFYSHVENPFTDESAFKIVTEACEGGTPEMYAVKVYGDAKANLETSSFARYTQKGRSEWKGWRYSQEKLTADVAQTVVQSEVDCVDLDTQIVFDTTGRCWKYSTLLSTIPLPLLINISLHSHSPISQFVRTPKFRNVPIFLSEGPITGVPHLNGENGMLVNYCASGCHPYYRATSTVFDGKPWMSAEFSSAWAHQKMRALFPGKIWLEDDHDIQNLQRLKAYLQERNVLLFGRYGEWRPKGLTSHVWQESAALGESLP